MLNTIAGIPAHPLFVHLAVIAAPVAALLALWWAWKTQHRALATITLAVSLAGAAGTVLTRSTGEALLKAQGFTEENAGPLATHALYANFMTVSVAALTGVVIVLYILRNTTWVKLPANTINSVSIIGRLLLVVCALAVIVTTVMTGHAGAEQTWMN